MRLTVKQKKDLKFLAKIMLFLCVWALAVDAFLAGKIKNYYELDCDHQDCQMQTSTWFGLGKITELHTFRRPESVSLRYHSGRLPHYCVKINGKCLPFEFYFKKTAESFQNKIISTNDFKYSAFSLLLRWFLLVFGTSFLIAAAIVLLQKNQAK